MKTFTHLTDRQIALLMGGLHLGVSGKRELLITEAAFRLVRANGGPLTKEQENLAETVHDADYRLREAERRQRRSSSPRKVQKTGSRSAQAKVISINAL